MIITILLLTGLFFVGLLFLFFVPSSSIFGIAFISYNDRYISNSYEIEDVDKIILNSRSYDIEIESTKSSKISARVENHSLGYVLKKNSQLILKEDFTNGILTFTINEPYGAAFKNNSQITLLIPNAAKDKSLDLSLENKNADVLFDDEKVTLRNLAYKAENGVVKLKKVNIKGSLNLDLNKTNFNLSSDCVLNNCNVNLKTTTGKFNASKSNINNLVILKNERGVILLDSCSTIIQSETTTGGRIEANKVDTISFTGSDTNIYIEEVTTRASISMLNSGSGKIEINKLSGIADIVTGKGDITIRNCTNNLTTLTTLSNNGGNITIYNAYNKVFAETSTGNVNVSFADDASSITQDNKNTRYFKGITETGKIVANGLNRTDIEIKENGSAELTFKHFEKDLSLINTIQSKSGNVYVKVDSRSAFVLNSYTKSGNSRINLLQTEKYKGWTENEIKNEKINYTKNQTIPTNANYININITESGNILMHDDKVN